MPLQGWTHDSFWTGTEVLVWSSADSEGSTPGFEQFLAYDPSADRWRTLPPSGLSPRGDAVVVWAGQGVETLDQVGTANDVFTASLVGAGAHDGLGGFPPGVGGIEVERRETFGFGYLFDAGVKPNGIFGEARL